jgi:hypothetical protein
MKKTLCLATVLAFATIATAGVDLYVAVGDGSQGIAPAANTINTPHNFVGDGPAVPPVGDYLGVAPFNSSVLELMPGTYNITVYGQFTGDDIATYGNISGIHLNAYGTGGFAITNSLYYLHSKTSGKPAQQYTRWDNTDPVDFHTSPDGGIVAAVQQSGITRQAVGYPSYVYDIYDADTEQFIIGMMQVEVTGVPGELYLGLGRLGLVGRATTGADLTGYETTLNGEVLQAAGTTPGDNGPVYGLIGTAIPEPASLLLLGLAGLLIRRR